MYELRYGVGDMADEVDVVGLAPCEELANLSGDADEARDTPDVDRALELGFSGDDGLGNWEP